jgi:hypothetical protein
MNPENLKTTTTATSLAAGRIGWGWGDILNSANLHARTGKSTESRLGTWTWGLGTVTTCGTDLDVEGVDAELLAADSDVLGSQHGGVWRGLVTIGLDLHASGDTGDGFTATGITQKSAFEPAHKYNFPKFKSHLLIQGFTYERSVTCTKVSLKDAKIRATPKTSSPAIWLELRFGDLEQFNIPSRTCGPREIFSWAGRTTFFGGMVNFGRLALKLTIVFSVVRKKSQIRLCAPRLASELAGVTNCVNPVSCAKVSRDLVHKLISPFQPFFSFSIIISHFSDLTNSWLADNICCNSDFAYISLLNANLGSRFRSLLRQLPQYVGLRWTKNVPQGQLRRGHHRHGRHGEDVCATAQ